jgi:predicted nucleic acid-binding protein
MNHSESLFIDTSAIYALINRSDIDHKQARDCLTLLSSGNHSFVTSNFVISETYTLILYKIGRDTALRVTNGIRDTYEIERVSVTDEDVAWQIINDYDDKKFSFVDATTFALMSRIGISYAFSFDDHFSQYPGIQKFPE